MPAAGVPESSPAALSARFAGSAAPVFVNVIAVGNPDAVSWKLGPAVPTVKVAVFPLVKAGGCVTVSVKFCVASGAMPLLAVNWRL